MAPVGRRQCESGLAPGKNLLNDATPLVLIVSEPYTPFYCALRGRELSLHIPSTKSQQLAMCAVQFAHGSAQPDVGFFYLKKVWEELKGLFESCQAIH